MRIGGKLIGVIIVIAVLLSVAAISIKTHDDSEVFSANLYFINQSSTTICEEKRAIKYNNSSELPNLVLNALKSGPTDSNNIAFISKKTEWTIGKNNEHLTVDFTDDFLTTDNSRNLLAAYAVVKSLCSIDGIADVKVTVEGGELVTPDNSTMGFLSDGDINLESDKQTSENRNIRLYFLTDDGMLKEEWRNVKITDTVPVEQYVVNELIKGPESEELSPVLSTDTKLISVEVTDGTAYINMAQSFIDKNKGAKETAAVYSIVNSVAAVDGVNNVQFLIDGKKTDSFDTVDISVPIFRNDGIVKK